MTMIGYDLRLELRKPKDRNLTLHALNNNHNPIRLINETELLFHKSFYFYFLI
jgi:hypothetical protein